MSETEAPFIAIDEEGLPRLGEIRVTDADFGREILQNLHRNDNGSFKSTAYGTTYFIEAFDDPLVVQTLERKDDRFTLNFPYGWQAELNPESLVLDEWDRFHGRTASDIPFVFSRKAQALFFDALDEFDDESITVGGRRHVLPTWLPESSQEDPGVWEQRYQSRDTAWDLAAPAPALADMLPRMKWPKSRVLVLGCGRGHDAAFFASQGHLVTGVDLSETALKEAREIHGERPHLRWLQADALNLPKELEGKFDVVFEHTCYCAIPPERRGDLVRSWLKALTPKGHLMGVFFVNDRRDGPPFGGSEWEVRERLRKHFDFRFWGRWKNSPPRRHGTELFVFAERK